MHSKGTRFMFSAKQLMVYAAQNINRYGLIAGLFLVFLVFASLRPNVFLTIVNLTGILKQVSLLGIISAGLTVCLVLGDWDLSIAAVATWSGVLTAALLPHTNMWLVILLVLLGGMGLGLVNGFLSVVVGIPSFITTLAMKTMLSGLTLWYTGGYSLYSGIPSAFVNLARGEFLGLSYLVYDLILIYVIFYIILDHSAFGKKIYATGGNPQAAWFSGISTGKIRLTGFIISSFFAALTGILLAARLSSGQPRAGEGLLLNAFAAVFLGAAASQKGRFNIAGTLFGVLFIGILNNGLTILGVPFYLQYVIQGSVLILAVSVSRIVRR